MGVGIAITRGSAASLSFCYSLLLLTMSRNLLTKLKDFPIQQYIPLDSHIQFHKIVACTALFFSLLHTAGHIVNFYHGKFTRYFTSKQFVTVFLIPVSTQPVEHLRCLVSFFYGVAPNVMSSSQKTCPHYKFIYLSVHCSFFQTKEMLFPSDFRPTIFYWLFETVTGITGVILFVTMVIIFVFGKT